MSKDWDAVAREQTKALARLYDATPAELRLIAGWLRDAYEQGRKDGAETIRAWARAGGLGEEAYDELWLYLRDRGGNP